ncbi:hypothetical protein IE53DRAFT_308543, partial [Violaceomyces palustris]
MILHGVPIRTNLAHGLSLFCWLVAGNKQLFENYKRGSVEGLSVVFLSQWMLGDATNLIGCVLTHQLSFQIAVATYFCCIDFCIMIQFYYYWRKGRRATTAQELADGTAGLEASVGSLRTGVRKRHGSYASYQSSTYPFGVGALETSEVLPEASRMRIIGRMSAWTCTVLYMTSRLPQIWANYERRSVEGLSILLFLSAFLGNLTYTISVLANPLSSGPSARDYIAESIPFLLGSGGTLIFDLTIMFQWWLWSARKAGR